MKKLVALAAVVPASLALAAPASAAKTVRVGDDFFRPATLSVKKGTVVRWRFVGDSPHNVTVTRGPQKFRSSTKTSGSYRKKMRRKGRYTIVCTIHPGMDMKLRVR